jgi:hypothetical protein
MSKGPTSRWNQVNAVYESLDHWHHNIGPYYSGSTLSNVDTCTSHINVTTITQRLSNNIDWRFKSHGRLVKQLRVQRSLLINLRVTITRWTGLISVSIFSMPKLDTKSILKQTSPHYSRETICSSSKLARPVPLVNIASFSCICFLNSKCSILSSLLDYFDTRDIALKSFFFLLETLLVINNI